MVKLIYSMLMSLDGHVEDERGRLGWGAPEDEEVRSYINQLASSVGTYLYGAEDVRDDGLLGDRAHGSRPAAVRARLWQAAEKIVYSRTLTEPRSVRTRVERAFDPDAVRRLKANVRHDITVDGPELAAHALRAGLVVCPLVVGAGKRFFPDRVQLKLELVDKRRFRRGVVVLRYAVRG